ncbi:RluA family pseudouridine synthase [Rarobacter incanus]
MRDGLGPVRLQIAAGPWSTIAEYLIGRFPWDEAGLRQKIAAGEVVDELGRPLHSGSPATVGSLVFLYRDPPRDEIPVPFEAEILHRDDDLMVVDKPHFLATTPRGSHVRETVLARLRARTGLDELSPAHRLDLATAGVLLLTTRRELRGPYQMAFQRRDVVKTYEAIAPYRAELASPTVVRSRIHKVDGVVTAAEVPGEPNAESLIELVGEAGQWNGVRWGRYRLTPHTGKTHQLRLHMMQVGAPILGDDYYPHLTRRAEGDFTNPLRLLSRSLQFVDPLSGELRTFTSRRELAAPGAAPDW